MKMMIEELSAEICDRVIALRRDFHRHPELGYQEKRTAKIVADTLREWGVEVREGIAQTGVLGTIRGNGPGKVLMLRADMDALPIQENTSLDYSSETPGVMHACAHDGHTATLLGVAYVLQKMKDSWPGTVKLLFQPSEEYDNAAGKVVRAGVLENPAVDCALGMHLWGPRPKGEVYLREGPLMASPGRFVIKLTGKGGHASRPDTAVNPVDMAAAAIQSIRGMMSTSFSPFDDSVLTFCAMRGGNSYNIIPELVELEGTIRTFELSLAERIVAMMDRALASVAQMYGGGFELHYDDEGIPPVYNDPGLCKVARNAAEKMLSPEKVHTMEEPDMGADDFAIYSQKVPSVYLFMGIADDPDNPPMHHNPRFAWQDDVLLQSMRVMGMAAVDVLHAAP